jgi:hypothetical protein
MKKGEKGRLHVIAGISLVILIVLGLACSTTPSAQIELSPSYKEYLSSPAGNERAFDAVRVRGTTSFQCRDQSHSVASGQVLGSTYKLGGEMVVSGTAEAKKTEIPTERHRHEVIFEQLLSEAQKQYPNEKVNIRSAKTVGHNSTNYRLETYSESVRGSDGRYYSVQRTRPIWDCYPVYEASVITTEPMPPPVAHTDNFTVPGATRNDIYRRTINWLEDNKTRRRITVESADMERGRIKGTVICATRADQTYIITSNYTIDVYDARVEMKFEDTVLQRTDPAQQRIGRAEQIFLKSVADKAMAELVDFSTTLKSSIQSRR